jgi:hypothetical protein|tara:strand:+ start:148 stop:651 length:504 start_codon:yes stop_codon:yes gene_type:complete
MINGKIKENHMSYKYLILTAIVATATAVPIAINNATTIKLHASPSAESLVVSDMSLSKGITILPSTWVQVQDPTTKKIGWVTQQEVQNILQNNNATITTHTNNSNGSYSSVTEIHNFTTNGMNQQNKELASNIAAEQQEIKRTLKKNMHYFQKIGEVTNDLFENIFG